MIVLLTFIQAGRQKVGARTETNSETMLASIGQFWLQSKAEEDDEEKGKLQRNNQLNARNSIAGHPPAGPLNLGLRWPG